MYKIFISESHNPFFNIAFENFLVQNTSINDEILFLWQNEDTVVIGRNQNPWNECNISKLKEMNGNLVRRLSGGGAVYHDLGNLNFTFISGFSENKMKENISVIIKSLSSCGINACFSGKNDILVGENKVSGNAFYVENDILCHHGTLLIDTDFNKLSEMLTVSDKKLKSKGIDSVKSRVKNLKEFHPGLSTELLREAIIKEFLPKEQEYSTDRVSEELDHYALASVAHIHNLMQIFKSWEWNYGSSPEFNCQISERFAWGGVNLYLNVQDGHIVDIKTETDSMDIYLPGKLKNILKGKKFDFDEIISLLSVDL